MKNILIIGLLLAFGLSNAQEKKAYPRSVFERVEVRNVESGSKSDSIVVIDSDGTLKKIGSSEAIDKKIEAEVASGFVSMSNSETKYQKGNKFKGTEGETITLLKWKKIPGGFYAWKSEFEISGKKKTLYVPEMYLDKLKTLVDNER